MRLLGKKWLRLREKDVDLGAAGRAGALRGATALLIDAYGSLDRALLLALHAIGVSLICLSHTVLQSSPAGLGAPANTLTIPSPCA